MRPLAPAMAMLILPGSFLAAAMNSPFDFEFDVVVIGGGFGGATAARYLKRMGVNVTLIEANATYTAAPLSSLVVAGARPIERQRFGYDAMASAGIEVVHATAVSVDAGKRRIGLTNGASIAYDRLVLSPGIDIAWVYFHSGASSRCVSL